MKKALAEREVGEQVRALAVHRAMAQNARLWRI
jgi:hypothetical protein